MSIITQDITPGKIARAAVWTSSSLIVVRLFFLTSSIITARLLNSEDFGIIGIAGAVYMLIDTTSATGIGSFLIYKQDLTSKESNTAFTLNFLIAMVFGGIVILTGVIVAQLYHKHQIQNVLSFAGIAFFFSTLGGIPRALLIKNMKQHALAIIDVSVNFLNFILIIVFAFLGYKYLSYVIPLTIYQAVCTASLFLLAGQLFRPSLNKEVIHQIFKYSRNFTPQIFLADLLYQVDYIIGSAYLTSAKMGFYYFGFEKAFLIAVFTRGVSEQVLFPVFSKSQYDLTLLKQNYFKLSSYFMFLLFPLLFFVILMAKELLILVYGTQWNNSIFTFQCILCFFVLKINYDISINLFNAVGKSDKNLRHFLIVAPHTFLLFFIGAKMAGITGLAIAAFFAHSISALCMMRRLSYVFGWSFYEQIMHLIKYLIPVFAALLFSLLFKYLFTMLAINTVFHLVSQAIVFFSLYFVFSNFFNPEIIKEIFILLKNKVNHVLHPSALNTEIVPAAEMNDEEMDHADILFSPR